MIDKQKEEFKPGIENYVLNSKDRELMLCDPKNCF